MDLYLQNKSSNNNLYKEISYKILLETEHCIKWD